MNTPLNRWSRKYDECQGCGTTDNAHQAGGYCTLCYSSIYRKKVGQRPVRAWSKSHAACAVCGKTDRKHVGKGLCARCRQREKSQALSANRAEAISRKALEPKSEPQEAPIKRERFNANGLRKGDLVKTHSFKSGEYERESGQIIDFVSIAGELFARVQRLQFPYGLDRWSVGKCTRFGHMEVAR